MAKHHRISKLFLPLFIITLTIGCQKQQIKEPATHDGFIKLSKEQRIEDRFAQELEMTIDPALGYVPRKALMQARREMQRQLAELSDRAAIPNIQWQERGPNNIGGRTRGVMFDPNDATAKKVWSGSVGGGLWYTNDITASNANWQKVDDFWSNMAIASMDADPVNTMVFYVGTGEGFGNADAIDGDGIWKSTDGGTTWNQMANTTGFNDCNKIVCFKADHILVATNNGLELSTDAGASWTEVRSGSHSDAEVSANGDLYASNFSGDIYKSTNDGATWSAVRTGSGGRVEIAVAPSDNNYVYALVNVSSQVNEVLKSTNAGGSWSSLSSPNYLNQNCSSSSQSFARGQAWYDLIAIVSPNDRDKIIVGGVDLHRSEDGGSTWSSISYWTGNCDAYLHADQHALISRPGFPDAIVSGNDGGIGYSSNAFTTGSNPTFNIQNENYNVTQFYATAVHPDAATINIIAGAQDNGTKRLTSAGIGSGSNVTGGDGAFCHIDQDQPNLQITSYVYNNYYVSTNGSNFSSYSLGNFGRFINPTDYDNATNKLYCTSNADEYVIVENVGGTLSNQTKTIAGFTGRISCVKVSPNVANRVYFGISGQRICYVDDAAGTPVFTNLGNPSSGYISSIDIELGNENHILATYSNYGVTSVVESTNGGTSWQDVEGDLPNMPVRWGVFNPNDADQAIIATELGVWSTDNLNGGSTDWDPTNSGLANVRVDMIEYRQSDYLMVAATHGRGIFTTESFNLDCNIGTVAVGAQVCDVLTDTYTQELTLTLNNTPASGNILINGQSFTFPLDVSSTTQTYTLTGLIADGADVDVVASYTAEPTCNKTVTNVFTAPNPGCILENTTCANAFNIPGTGTYATDGPSSGNGCNNCSNATHADWWKFTPTDNGTIDIASCGYGEDTRFWVYEGSCGALVQIESADDECPMTQGGNSWASEELNIPVIANTTYYIEWDDRWSDDPFSFDFTFNPCPSGQAMIFVDQTATGTNTGCSWLNAKTNLQDAIQTAASRTGVTEVWVKAGTYYPGLAGAAPTRATSFDFTQAIQIIGGFNGTETDKANHDPLVNVTILSGDIGIPNNDSDNSLHLINHDQNYLITLDGLILEKGNANLAPDLSGAAIYNEGAIDIKDCIIRNNASTDFGSGIVNTGASALMNLENVEVTGNSGVSFVNAADGEVNVVSGSTAVIE